MAEAGRNAGVNEKAAGGHISNRMKILGCIPARLSPARLVGKFLGEDAGKFLGLYTCDDAGARRQYAEFVKRYKNGHREHRNKKNINYIL